ncbi:MAG: peroxiredoxin [Bacteroidia bacterium]|nr:peroxiredoxin [Bacteroidia bacterium]
MALRTGDLAPDFTLPSTAGRPFNLRLDALGRPLVLYFYPKDFTGVCTAEACGFRDEFAHFHDLNVPVVGISRDTLATHHRFRAAYNLPFELLSDTEGTVTEQYAGKLPLVGWSQRTTYLLDADQRVVLAFNKLFESRSHIAQVKAALAKLGPSLATRVA